MLRRRRPGRRKRETCGASRASAPARKRRSAVRGSPSSDHLRGRHLAILAPRRAVLRGARRAGPRCSSRFRSDHRARPDAAIAPGAPDRFLVVMLATLAVQQVMFNVVSPRILSRSVGVHLLFVATPSSSARASPAWAFRDPVRRDRLDLPPLRLRVAKAARPLRGRGVIAAGARRVTRHPRHERRRIEADALGPLERARRRRGPRHRPERNWSGASHSITLLRLMPPDAPARRAASVHDRRTIDCVRPVLGFLGTSPTSSSAGSIAARTSATTSRTGHRAAAMEGILSNVPPSRSRSPPSAHPSPTSGAAASSSSRGFTPDALLNVNVPNLPPIGGVEVTRLGTRNYRDVLSSPPVREPLLRVGGSVVDAHAEPGTDIDAVRRGKISVTDPPDLRAHTRSSRNSRCGISWSRRWLAAE